MFDKVIEDRWIDEFHLCSMNIRLFDSFPFRGIMRSPF